jgi:DNA-binding MarR family transcriptional regulator
MADMIFAKPRTKPKAADVLDGKGLRADRGIAANEAPALTRIDDRRPAVPAALPSDAELIEMIELFFFAYRDFIGDADAILDEFAFGRAHHRVVYFVNRSPGMTVAELLDILKITKQSLGRVLRDLVEAGFIAQQTGEADRRQRLLYTTPKGEALAKRLTEPQMRRISQALAALGPAGADITSRFLRLMTNDDDRQPPTASGAKR